MNKKVQGNLDVPLKCTPSNFISYTSVSRKPSAKDLLESLARVPPLHYCPNRSHPLKRAGFLTNTVRAAARPFRLRSSSLTSLQHIWRTFQPWRFDARDLFGQLQRFDQGVRWASDDVALADAAFFHRLNMSTCGVFDMRPAIGDFVRDERQAPTQIIPQGIADGAGVARAVIDAGLHDDQRQACLHHW